MSSDVSAPASGTDAALPANYRTVFDVVDAAGPGSHLTAQEIWLRARAVQPRIGFATVHRALVRLAERGRVMKIGVPGEASAVYEPAASPHAHFRCTACGTISDLAFALPKATVDALAAAHDIAIDAEIVTFSGRCSDCS